MPFDHLLFFGDEGHGDPFAFPNSVGEVRRPDVFPWNHETDGRTWIATALDRYGGWWLKGEIRA